MFWGFYYLPSTKNENDARLTRKNQITQDAFNNIIAQCIQKEGRNGGEWTWSSGGLTQNYYLQFNRVCRSKRELQHNAINGVISEGAFNATSDATSVETEESK